MMSSWIRLGKLPCLMLVNPAQNIFVIQRAVGHTKAQRNQVSIRVSFPLQAGKQIFQAGGCGYQPVDGGFQLCLIAGAVLCGLMLNIALALVLARDDDRQAVFSAQSVAGPAYLVIAMLVGMIVLVVGETDRIENQMVE